MIQKTINNIITSIKREKIEGETIETKCERIVINNEPITDGAPIIYQERKDGISPDCDIRTDRMDIAIDAMDTVSKSKLAHRIELHKAAEKKAKEAKAKAESQSTQGTEPPQQGS